MLYQALFTARNAGIFTAGLHGTTEGNILRVEHEPKKSDAPIGYAGCGSKGGSGSIPACFREKYQRSAGE